MAEVLEHGFLVKDVKHISRYDGNLIGVVLHAPFDTDLWARLGIMIDESVNVMIESQQQELGMDEPEGETPDLKEE